MYVLADLVDRPLKIGAYDATRRERMRNPANEPGEFVYFWKRMIDCVQLPDNFSKL